MSPISWGVICFTLNAEPDGYPELESALWISVEERPFQGRVTIKAKMGLSPRSLLGCRTGAKAHIIGRPTRR